MRRSAALFICCLSLAVSLSSASIAVAEETTVVGRPTPLPPNVVPTKPHGETIDDKSQYAHCVALARSKPDDGWEEALAWSSLGGGEPARHCAAIALVGLGQYEEAANRFERLASESHDSPKLRAGMLAQAGQAWLLARNVERAYAAQTSALALVPDAPDLLVDRAATLGQAKNYKEALDDLNKALALDHTRVDGLIYRATAKRYLDDPKGAETDISVALTLDPNNADAWMEDGNLKRLRNETGAARKSWMKVLELAPDSPAADMARKNIETLDVKDR